MYKAYINWSSGKDAALAYFFALSEKKYEISQLLTTINTTYDRVSMHGLRKELLLAQAQSLGLPLKLVTFTGNTSMQLYSQKMREACEELKSQGYTHSIFGDIFLDDLRAYRDKQLEEIGLKGEYPLWKKNTRELALTLINEGFKAIVVTVNASKLDKSFCGRKYDESFLNDLPDDVDWCGEHGEFHTFVYDAPFFKNPVNFTVGETVLKSYPKSDDTTWDTSFYYTDLYIE